MGERWSKHWPFIIGIALPLAFLLTNTVWNYAGIVLTVISLVWIGFAVILLAPTSTA